MSMEISFASNAASEAWDAAGLGMFDSDSVLAEEVDSDKDGSITEDEVKAYQQSKASLAKKPDNKPTLDKAKTKTSSNKSFKSFA